MIKIREGIAVSKHNIITENDNHDLMDHMFYTDLVLNLIECPFWREFYASNNKNINKLTKIWLKTKNKKKKKAK